MIPYATTRTEVREEAAQRDIHEEFIIRGRRGSIDARDADERDPRQVRADQGHRVATRQAEPVREAFPQVREAVRGDRPVNPNAALEVDDEDVRVRGASDDRLAREGAEAEDLRAHL